MEHASARMIGFLALYRRSRIVLRTSSSVSVSFSGIARLNGFANLSPTILDIYWDIYEEACERFLTSWNECFLAFGETEMRDFSWGTI